MLRQLLTRRRVAVHGARHPKQSFARADAEDATCYGENAKQRGRASHKGCIGATAPTCKRWDNGIVHSLWSSSQKRCFKLVELFKVATSRMTEAAGLWSGVALSQRHGALMQKLGLPKDKPPRRLCCSSCYIYLKHLAGRRLPGVSAHIPLWQLSP